MKKQKRKNIRRFPIRYIVKIEAKEIVVIICTFIGVVFTVMQIYDWIGEHKKPDIVVQEDISISYLDENIMQNNNFYPLFEDYVDSDREYLFTGNCATQLMITNHYENQIVLDKIILEVNEIIVDYRPILHFQDGYNLDDGITVCIANIGWGEAKNLKISAIGIDKNLEDYFEKEALEFEISDLDYGKSINIPFLKNSDILGEFPDWTDFNISFKAESEDGIKLETYGVILPSIYEGKILYDGLGGVADHVYGIKINTDSENFLWEESILEFIDQGETLVFPICFFPDKSCSLKLKVSFEIVNDGRKEMISTDFSKMQFAVSSIPEWNSMIIHPIEDMEIMDGDGRRLIKNDINSIISYPENPAIKFRQ